MPGLHPLELSFRIEKSAQERITFMRPKINVNMTSLSEMSANFVQTRTSLARLYNQTRNHNAKLSLMQENRFLKPILSVQSIKQTLNAENIDFARLRSICPTIDQLTVLSSKTDLKAAMSQSFHILSRIPSYIIPSKPLISRYYIDYIISS